MIDITDKTAMLAKAPKGNEDLSGWVMEPKYDGWRIMAKVNENGVQYFSRAGLEYSGHTPLIDEALMSLPVGTVLDGEMIHPNGWRHVQTIFGSPDRTSTEIQYVAFDVLVAMGHDIRHYKLHERRQALHLILQHMDDEHPIQMPTQVPYTEEGTRALIDEGWEGAIVKDPNAPYQSGRRSPSWLKFKAIWTEDVVVTGATEGKGKWAGSVGALTIAQVGPDGRLVPLGQCRGKITEKAAAEFTARWRDGSLPGMVIEISVLGITPPSKGFPAGLFRSPTFQRIRTDKRAQDCILTDKSAIYTI